MTRKKEIERESFKVYPKKLGYSTIIEKTVDYNGENRKIWVAGAEWADAHPVHYDGKAYLYVLHKGVEQGKKEMLDKAIEWLRNETMGLLLQPKENYELVQEFVDCFKEAMEE